MSFRQAADQNAKWNVLQEVAGRLPAATADLNTKWSALGKLGGGRGWGNGASMVTQATLNFRAKG